VAAFANALPRHTLSGNHRHDEGGKVQADLGAVVLDQ
jgi:hypothetical protein